MPPKVTTNQQIADCKLSLEDAEDSLKRLKKAKDKHLVLKQCDRHLRQAKNQIEAIQLALRDLKEEKKTQVEESVTEFFEIKQIRDLRERHLKCQQECDWKKNEVETEDPNRSSSRKKRQPRKAVLSTDP